jgi:hypothetical protein
MEMVSFCQKYNIILGHSTTYYPQGNGLAESSNKSLITIIKKVLSENKRSWHVHLKYALWENRIGTKKSIGTSPFQMVYGTDVVLPINLALPVFSRLKFPRALSLSMFGASIPFFSAFLCGANLISVTGTYVFSVGVPTDFDLKGCVSAVWVFAVFFSATFGAASSVSPLGKIFFFGSVERLLFLGLRLYFSCSSAIISSAIP